MTHENNTALVEAEIVEAPTTALARQTPLQTSSLMPVFTTAQAIERYESYVAFVQQALHEGTDYGKIPGTDKKTLFKPGAEKLCTFFGLSVRFELKEATEDWTGYAHEGEPFFNYRYSCTLWRGEQLVAESEASCNSWEKKYRWRQGQAKCPECGEATIFKSRNNPEWYCWRKKNGCGATFPIDDKRITSQDTSRSPNEDIADQVNTLQKMAQKRALIGSTLIAVNASEFFTQDVEDFMPGVSQPLSDETSPPPSSPPLPREKRQERKALPPTQSASAPANRAEVMRQKRGEGIAAMGLVKRDGEGSFSVQTPALKGRSVTYTVKRDQGGHVICSCEEFQNEVIKESAYRCEHIFAVKHALLNKPKATTPEERTTAAPVDQRTASALDRTARLAKIEDARAILEKERVEPGWSTAELTQFVNELYEVEHGINDDALTLDQLKEISDDLWSRVDEHFKKKRQFK